MRRGRVSAGRYAERAAVHWPRDPLNPKVLPPDAHERTVRLLEHRPLVRRIANRMMSRLPASVEMDELMQAGMIGLDEAISRFEEGRGATFDTYASRRIEGSMLDALRANDDDKPWTRASGSFRLFRDIRICLLSTRIERWLFVHSTHSR